MTASSAATGSGNSNTETLKKNATSAPNVTSSPCAKFVSPVTANTSDSPSDATASTSPKRTPSAVRSRMLSQAER